MNRCFVFALLLVAFKLCASAPLRELPSKAAFEEYWKLVDESQAENESFQEWIPKSETDSNWTKSFGIQCYTLEKQYDLKHFYNLFIETLAQDFAAQPDVFHHQIERQDDDHLIFSWWCDGKNYEIGREWVHLLKEKENRVVFARFATKASEANADDELWRVCIRDLQPAS